MNSILPPEITFKKQRIEGCWVYSFRHNTLGELGRIIVQGLPNDQSNVSCEVVGDLGDPMTEVRFNILRPLTDKITEALESKLGPGQMSSEIPPLSPKTPQEIVESKVIPCKQCGAYVAMLIFAYAVRDMGVFEDYARKMYIQYRNFNLPTWIIGEPIGMASFDTPSWILKVWPNREPIQQMGCYQRKGPLR